MIDAGFWKSDILTCEQEIQSVIERLLQRVYCRECRGRVLVGNWRFLLRRRFQIILPVS